MIQAVLQPPFSILIGLILALAVAGVAYKIGVLTRSGAIAAVIAGTVIFGLGSLAGAILLLTFFISSSALSRAFARRKNPLNEKFSKGSRRDAGQVLANGGPAMVFVIIHSLIADPGWAWAGLVGSLAAVNADTWATELGVLSKTPPRLITTGKPVERGTSGGVSLMGSLASLAGAGLVALLAILLAGPAWRGLPALAVFALAGLLGSLVDSLLGGTLQAIYCCPACQKETERHPVHTCGTSTYLLRGLPWLNNDLVNVACGLTGGLLAAAAFAFTPGWLMMPASTQIQKQGEISMSFPITSTAFDMGGMIPSKYTCTGENRSPALSWKDLPSGTRSLALITEDPDAPSGTFIHWVLYNIPPTVTQLSEGLPKNASIPNAGTQGTNSFGKTGYDGPCPPPGPAHRYYFKLYALDIEPTLPPGLKAVDVRKHLQGHILAEADWMGKYGR